MTETKCENLFFLALDIKYFGIWEKLEYFAHHGMLFNFLKFEFVARRRLFR